ncbi:MAG: M48 family metallopeptidase [Marinicellaceae bacterium]
MAKKLFESNHYIAINDEVISYVLKRSKKRKVSIAMRFNHQGQLQINAPYRTHQSYIDEFITAKYQWIKTQQKLVEQKANKKKLAYHQGSEHYFLGQCYFLNLQTSKSSQVLIQENQLIVFHRKNSNIKAILDRWYKNQALEYFINRTQDLASQYKFPEVKSIKIRNMRARWGSCNSRSEITYNTHLIKTSKECIDYVIIHELCHLIQPNHSALFYQLQSKINPQWKAQKQLLNQFDLS